MSDDRKYPKVVVVDFDGTISKEVDFPNVGLPEHGVREALQKIKDLGYLIHIHSCRTATYWAQEGRQDRGTHIEIIRNFLIQHKIPYHKIIVEANMDKPIAQYYIDNRAIRYENNWDLIAAQIEALGKNEN
jgi:hypothetical protein